MSLRDYIHDPYDINIIRFYIKTEKINGKYESRVYQVLDRAKAIYPYYDIQWNKVLENHHSKNIFKAFLTHKKLVKKWRKDFI